MASVDTSERLLRWLHVGAADACVCGARTGSQCAAGDTVCVAFAQVLKPTRCSALFCSDSQ